MVIPFFAFSLAIALVIPQRPALEAAYELIIAINYNILRGITVLVFDYTKMPIYFHCIACLIFAEVVSN